MKTENTNEEPNADNGYPLLGDVDSRIEYKLLSDATFIILKNLQLLKMDLNKWSSVKFKLRGEPYWDKIPLTNKEIKDNQRKDRITAVNYEQTKNIFKALWAARRRLQKLVGQEKNR